MVCDRTDEILDTPRIVKTLADVDSDMIQVSQLKKTAVPVLHYSQQQNKQTIYNNKTKY